MGKRWSKFFSEDLWSSNQVTEMFLPFVRAHFGDNESCRLPKTLLLVYCRSTKIDKVMLEEFKFSLFRQKGLEQPKYMMETVDKQFRASVKVKWLLTLTLSINIHHLLKVGEDLFGSTVLEKNKKYAEQVFQIQHYSNSSILYCLCDIFINTFSMLTYHHFLNRELLWLPSSASISPSRVLFGKRRRTLITWKSQMVLRSRRFIIFYSIPNKFSKNWKLHSYDI